MLVLAQWVTCCGTFHQQNNVHCAIVIAGTGVFDQGTVTMIIYTLWFDVLCYVLLCDNDFLII